MRVRGVANALRRAPLRAAVGLLLLGGVYAGMLAATRRGVSFLDTFPDIGTIADAVERRSLEALFTVLMVGVAFSVLTSAVTTLYDSSDLPLLLSLPVAPARVFGLKVAETYVTSAFLPMVFTLPVLVGLGLVRHAPPVFYLVSVATVLALYGLPVALGSTVALLLMRLAPAGRAKEASTAVSVALAALLVFGLRALRPEQLNALDSAQFEHLLARFASLDIAWLPPSWASSAVWHALDGRLAPAAFVLALVSVVLLALVARLAAWAYRAGWIRSLDSARRRARVGALGASAWERPLARLGPQGALVVKDLRLLARDPSQWAQVLVLLALGGVYFVSTVSMTGEMPGLRDVVGALNVVFLGFLLAGVGIRTAFPLVSLEGEGVWLLRTGPLRARHVVMAKFWGALPLMLALGGGLGIAVAGRLNVSPVLAFATPIVGVCAALAATGLGVGLGAAFPRFDATNAAEIPLSTGGLLYMALSLGYAALMAVVFAYPSYLALRFPGRFVWTSAGGALVIAIALLATAAATVVPLVLGARALGRFESTRG